MEVLPVHGGGVMREPEIIGEPIQIHYFAGGLDSPTFMERRKVIVTAYVEAESVQLYKENEEAAARLGEQMGRLLHKCLRDEVVA